MKSERTMLIVEDSEINQQICISIFEGDYNILTADDGDVALDILGKDPGNINIVLLDISMPRMSGYDVIRVMRSDERFKHIPIVVITSFNEGDAEVRALELGADDFITRPFYSAVVHKRVKVVLERAEHEKQRINRIRSEEQERHRIKLNHLMDNIPGGVGMFELTDRLDMFDCNDGLLQLFGYESVEKMNEYSTDIFAHLNQEHVPELIRLSKQSQMDYRPFNYTLQIRRANGEFLWTLLNDCAVMLEDGRTMFYIVAVDITAEHHAREELVYRAEFDQLTGIYNKETFYKKTQALLRENPCVNFSIIRFNIERFKIVNDLFGHGFGDRVLRKFAENLKLYCDAMSSYCRLESDHFALCIPTERLNLSYYEQFIVSLNQMLGINHKVVVSVGIYNVSNIEVPVDQMCDRANLALQTIKGNYLRHFAYYDDELRQAMLEEHDIRNTMTEALAKHQFIIYLQPIHSISEDKTISAEVLVRWMHPEKGLITPGSFVPLFEKNGFIAKLDYYVWEEACRYLKSRRDRMMDDISLSVNCSRMSMYNPNLCSEIVALTRKYNVDPKLFRIEITETAYNDNPEQLLDTIRELQKNGFMILMDDFGSGYSSLNTLKDIPVDTLKIDMAFLKDLETSERASSIIMSVVLMAKWIKIPTIAEGVETKAQLDFMRSIGCDRIQGYYYAKPMPFDEFERYTENDHPTVISDAVEETISDDELNMIFNSNSMVRKLMSSSFGAMAFYRFVEGKLEVIRTNEGYCDIMGATTRSMAQLFDAVERHIDHEDRDKVYEACDKAVECGEPVRIKVRCHHEGDNRLMWVDALVRYIGGGKESPYFCIGFNDISSELDNSNQLQAIINAVPGGVALVEFGDRIVITYINSGFCSLLGYSVQEYENSGIGDDILQLIHPDDYNGIYQEMKKANANNETVTEIFRVKVKNGSYIWVSLQTTRVPAGSNRISRYVIIITDISEQRRNKEMKNRSQYGQLLFNVYDDIFEVDYSNNTSIMLTSRTNMEAESEPRVMDLDENINHYINEYIHPLDIKSFREFINRPKTTSDIIRGENSIEYRAILVDGTQKWISMDMMELGNQKYLICIRDISDNKTAKQINDAQRQSRQILDSLPGAIVRYCHEDGRLDYISSAFLDMIGYSVNDINTYFNGKFYCLVADDDQERVYNDISAMTMSGQVRDYEFKLKTSSGKNKDIYGMATMTYDNNNCHWFTAVMIEKKDVKHFGHTLNNERVDIVSKIIRSEFDYIACIDMNTYEYEMYDRKEGILEGEPDIGDFEESIMRVAPVECCEEDLERYIGELSADYIRKSLALNPYYEFTYRTRHSNRIKSIAISCLVPNDSSIVLFMCRDVTAVMSREQERSQALRCALENAEQANKSKTNFLAHMSHDIRTPLNVILGITSLIASGRSDEPVSESIHKIDVSGRLLLRILNDILDVATIEKGELILHPEPYRIADFIDDINTFIVPQMIVKDIGFEFDMVCRNECIYVDRMRFTQIFYNLLSNAVKYSPVNGKVRFTTEYIGNDDGAIGIRYYINDNGHGMSSEFMARAFEAFSKEENDQLYVNGGVGLGLTIVKKVIDAMNGSISVSSEIDKGTEFVIELYVPLATAPIADNDEVSPTNDKNMLVNTRVLIVEDIEINALIVKKLLETSGAVTEIAENGKVALDMFASSTPGFYDAILMDRRMPVMDGIEATKRIRALDRADSKDVPIIALTADAYDNDTKMSFEAGMNAHLSKPIEPGLLLNVLNEQIEKIVS